ncbi:MAG: 50S ribosomal protein L35 [Spirochaetaceae bacterium]|nr:50S ribosomal protein L35 [Spirochaetaceae bacterium]
MAKAKKAKAKVKTRKSAASRYFITGSGEKVRFRGAGMRHILTKKSSKRKRQLRKMGVLDDSNFVKKVKQLIPYS